MLESPMQLGISGRIKVEVIDHRGRAVKSLPWQKNLWLDQGLNRLAVISLAQAFEYCAKGTGATHLPSELTTNTYTLDGSGGMVRVGTSGGARNFTSGDAGKYVRFSTGQEGKITAYTDATHVTLDNVADTVSAHVVTFYDVAETGMDVEVGPRTNTYSAVSGENGTTDSTNTRTLKRTFIFAAETSDHTYAEIGFSDSATLTTNLNARVALVTPVAVLGPAAGNPGQQLKVTYQVSITVTPYAITSSAGSGITNAPWNGNGTSVIETFATSQVALDGTTDLTQPDLEPFYPGTMAIDPSTSALSALGNTNRSAGAAMAALTADSYVAPTDSKSFVQTYNGSFGINDAIANNWINLMLFDPTSGQAIFTFKYGSVRSKLGTKALLVTFQKTWGRDLS